MNGYILGATDVSDTFAEAFPMRYARLLITGSTSRSSDRRVVSRQLLDRSRCLAARCKGVFLAQAGRW